MSQPRDDRSSASDYWRQVGTQKDQLFNIRAEALRQRTGGERLLARSAHLVSHRYFFLAEILFHVGWVALNAGAVPGVSPWDAYPFPLLTGLASMQALFIALLLLMHSQNEVRIDQVREETDLQVALHAERETTRLLQMMTELHRRLGVTPPVPEAELEEMSQPLDPGRLRASTERQLKETEKEML